MVVVAQPVVAVTIESGSVVAAANKFVGETSSPQKDEGGHVAVRALGSETVHRVARPSDGRSAFSGACGKRKRANAGGIRPETTIPGVEAGQN